jgi:FkbM family methyltransferase
MSAPRLAWWSTVSVAIAVAGALAPWAQTSQTTLDGADNEVVLVVAVLAWAVIVFFPAPQFPRIAGLSVLAGLVAATITCDDLVDPSGVADNRLHLEIHTDWGLWVAFFGSLGVAAAAIYALARAWTPRTPNRFGQPRELSPLCAAYARTHLALLRARTAESGANRAEQRRRRRFIDAAREMTPYVAVEKGDAVFFVPTRVQAGAGRFSKTGWKEERRLQRALQALSVGGIDVTGTRFVDVGAHVGTTTVLALRNHGFSSASAFEPEAENFRLLGANRAANGLEEVVEAYNVALSDRTGIVELHLRRPGSASHTLIPRPHRRERVAHVPATTLDTLVSAGKIDPSEVGLLWIDVEGHEQEVLAGSKSLLARSVPVVIEVNPKYLDRERLATLQALIAAAYTSVVDLRPIFRGAGDIRPLSAFADIVRDGRLTDVLLFRVSGSG